MSVASAMTKIVGTADVRQGCNQTRSGSLWRSLPQRVGSAGLIRRRRWWWAAALGQRPRWGAGVLLGRRCLCGAQVSLWGPGVEPLDLTDIPAGVYILTLIPPQGSRQMVRLVIQ